MWSGAKCLVYTERLVVRTTPIATQCRKVCQEVTKNCIGSRSPYYYTIDRDPMQFFSALPRDRWGTEYVLKLAEGVLGGRRQELGPLFGGCLHEETVT